MTLACLCCCTNARKICFFCEKIIMKKKIQHINIEQKTIKSYANSKEELKNESEKL